MSSPTVVTPSRPMGSPALRELESTHPANWAGEASPRSSGRYYAMDRDKRWDRTALAYNAHGSRGGATGDERGRQPFSARTSLA